MTIHSHTLRELEARFVKRHAQPEGWEEVDRIEDADGVSFVCPSCFHRQGLVGSHSILCWFEDKVPDDAQPGPGKPVGDLDTLTFVASKKSCSVQIGAHWHGYVRDGRVEVDSEQELR